MACPKKRKTCAPVKKRTCAPKKRKTCAPVKKRTCAPKKRKTTCTKSACAPSKRKTTSLAGRLRAANGRLMPNVGVMGAADAPLGGVAAIGAAENDGFRTPN
jgi:hypothetical protein